MSREEGSQSTHEDMREDKDAYESQEVEDRIAAHLAKFTGASDESPTPEPEDHESENDDEPTPIEKSEAEDSLGRDDEKSGKEDAADSGSEADEPAIPDNVFRSLVHSGWTPDEISEFYTANPKVADKVFSKIHDDVNNMSRQFAEIGRTRANAERQTQVQKQVVDQTPKVDPVAEALKAVKSDDPDNPLIPVVQALNESLRSVTDRQQPAQPQQPVSNIQEDMAVVTQIMNFLGSDGLRSYRAYYGPTHDEKGAPIYDGRFLPAGQRAARRELIETAEDIWVGAKMHGRELSIEEALGRAHSMITEPMRAQEIREGLVKAVKKRSSGMTLRPSKGRVTRPKGQKPLTDEQLEERTEARLRKLRSK